MISLLVLLEELSVIQLVGSLAQCLARGQCSANVNYSVGSQCMLSASVQKQAPVEGVNEPRSQALWFSVSEVKLRVSVASQQASVRH